MFVNNFVIKQLIKMTPWLDGVVYVLYSYIYPAIYTCSACIQIPPFNKLFRIFRIFLYVATYFDKLLTKEFYPEANTSISYINQKHEDTTMNLLPPLNYAPKCACNLLK